MPLSTVTIRSGCVSDTDFIRSGLLVGLAEEQETGINPIKLGMIAVPAPAAQAVADRLVAAGIEGIVNFAPVTISLPEGVRQVFSKPSGCREQPKSAQGRLERVLKGPAGRRPRPRA